MQTIVMAAGENNAENGGAVEELREPLIIIYHHQQEEKRSDKPAAGAVDEEDGSGSSGYRNLLVHDRRKEQQQQQLWIVYFSTLVAVCGSFEFGSCAGYSSPTQSAIREDLDLSIAEYSMFGSILTFGAMIGAAMSGFMADFFGRKGAMRISSGFCIAGWLAIYFAKGALCLDIGRLATGYGMGVFSYVVPVFISEIAPRNHRGLLTSLTQVGCGLVFVYGVGAIVSWRTLALTGIVPCVFLLLGLFLIPESPRWLAKKGRHEEFEAALQQLRGKEADISKEASEIQDSVEASKQLPKSRLMDLTERRYSRSLTIGIGLMVFQQLGGVNGVGFYIGSIFESVGFSSSIGSISYAVFQVFVLGIMATMVDKAGRKPFLLISASGLVIGSLMVGISFYLKDHDLSLKSVPILAVLGLLVYGGSYAAGMGAIPWIIMSEIFPMHVKGIAGSLATLVNWFCAWMVSYSFNFLVDWSSYGTFLLYAAINAVSIMFVIIVVPETKAKSLEQIQEHIDG